MQPPASSSTAATGRVSFTMAGISAGFVQGQVLAAGVLFYGVALGLLASQAHYSFVEALLMSAFVYSGSAQLAVMQNKDAGNLLLPALSLIMMMNARYLLYSAALRPWMGGLNSAQSYGTLFFLGDGNWALSMKRWEGGYGDAGFLLGSGLAMYCAWLIGTMIGHLAGNSIANPSSLGLDFLLVGFSAALMVEFWKGKSTLPPLIAAIVTAFCLNILAPGGWTIVAAGLAGAGVAFHLSKEPR